MKYQLKLTHRNGTEQIVPLPDGDHLIGRSRSAGIQVSEEDVSGKHLLLHVDGDSVIAENLSSHGSRARDTVIELPTPIRTDDTIILSKSLSVTLQTIPAPGTQSAPPPAPAADSAPELTIIGEPPPDNATVADPECTIIGEPPLETTDPERTIIGEPPLDNATVTDPECTIIGEPETVIAEENQTPHPSAPAESDPFRTNVMQTRIASAGEIDFLRRQDRKAVRGKKLKYAAAIAVFAILLATIYWFRGEAPEEKLSWPLMDNGNYSEKPFDNGDGGFAKGRFSVIAPLVSSTKSQRMDNGDLLIETRIGRDRDVPLRILLSIKHSSSFLREDRRQTMNQWIKEISAGGGHWNFDQISDLFFIGKNNGLPCLSVSYNREDDKQSWYGEALFFRCGDERIVRLVDIPASERVRGSDILSNNAFLFFAEEYVTGHWEGGGEIYSGNPDDLLNEAKSLLVKMSPATWDKISAILRSVLVAAMESGNIQLKEKALEQLNKLRSAQRVWYNAQCIAYLKEQAAGNERAADCIRDACLSVFASPDDLRNQNIKRNRWE